MRSDPPPGGRPFELVKAQRSWTKFIAGLLEEGLPWKCTNITKFNKKSLYHLPEVPKWNWIKSLRKRSSRGKGGVGGGLHEIWISSLSNYIFIFFDFTTQSQFYMYFVFCSISIDSPKINLNNTKKSSTKWCFTYYSTWLLYALPPLKVKWGKPVLWNFWNPKICGENLNIRAKSRFQICP